MRILVVGAGSTGGYFGGRLAQAGRDVTFLVRPARAAALAERGLVVRSPHGDFTLAPQLVLAGDIKAPFDVILLTVKAYALAAALDDIAPAVGAQSMILPVLNGMRHVDAIQARFGAKSLVGGVCKIASTLDAEGRIIQFAKMHDLAYGEMNGERTGRIEALDAQMQNAGFDAALSTTILQDMWEKWVMLASLGGVNCLMRGAIGEIVAAPGGLEFARAFLAECVAIASAAGHAPRASFMANVEALLTAPNSPMTSSMYRDLLAGSAIEAEQIIGDLLTRGQALGLQSPLLAACNSQLAVYQAAQLRRA